jgi:hypothetical protein
MKQAMVAALLVLALVGCNLAPTVDPNPDLGSNEPSPGFGLGSLTAFPTQPKSDEYLEALTQGTLVVADGCLRLQALPSVEYPYETNYLLYWRYGNSYRETDEGIQVLGADGKVIAKEGDYLVIGGGETSVNVTQGACEGLIWLVGEIASATAPQ